VRESDAAWPRIPFAAAKLAGEQLVRVACSAVGVTSTILRYSNVYGPDEPSLRPIPTYIRAALAGQPPIVDGEGFDEHDYVHVADAVDATMSALRRRADGVYNIGSGIGTTTLELVQLIVWISGGSAAPVRGLPTGRQPDRTSVVLDIAHAASELGYSPRHALSDGIAEEVGWFKGAAPSEPGRARVA
jgi:UDP-glucose 4-epimerase